LIGLIHTKTKFKVSMITGYEDMKCNNKVEIGMVWDGKGHLRSLAMSPFDRVHIISYFDFNKNYAFIFYHFRGKLNICQESDVNLLSSFVA